MKIILTKITLLICFGIIICVMSFCSDDVKGNHTRSQKINMAEGIKVLELFTSEGCSSCPPADALLVKLAGENKPGVFILTYHVDYWNRLGWTDSFSSAKYSERQRLYASQFNSESIYTPQLVVNGVNEFTGSDANRLKMALQERSSIDNPASLVVEIIKINENKITFTYSLPSSKDQVINFALVQSEATTKVKNGENGGRTLKHINIVRGLETVPLSGESTESVISFDKIPTGNAYFILAFAQDKKDLKITHAVTLTLPG